MEAVAEAIFWTQVPIAIGIIIVAYEMWLVKKELLNILEKLARKK